MAAAAAMRAASQSDVRPPGSFGSAGSGRSVSRMKWSKLALFASEMFLGGTINRVILAMLGRRVTPFGVEVGIAGNWAFAALDLVVAGLLYRAH